MTHDSVTAPAHYAVYPVQPIAVTRHLGFCLGNAVKYVLRAPHKGGAEDLRKALQYLEWEKETPQPMLTVPAAGSAAAACEDIAEFLLRGAEDSPLHGVRDLQAGFLCALDAYLSSGSLQDLDSMRRIAEEIVHVLEARA